MPEQNTYPERIRLVRGNIALLPVDAIVTAANSALMGGGGVDGAVHRAAGQDELRNALYAYDGCLEGEAVITPGFHLPAKWIIHAVGPIYVDGRQDEAATLASAYHCSLQLAEKHGAQSIAFPCIGTGAFRYPRTEAAEIAIRTVRAWLAEHTLPQIVYFCVFDAADAPLYEERLGVPAVSVDSIGA